MEDKNVKILDTNVLLDYPQIVTKDDEYWIIPICVLEEIDGLKRHNNPETAHKARKAAVYISKNMDNIEFYQRVGVLDEYTHKSIDSKLMDIASERNGVLVTNDIALKVFCIQSGVKTEGYSWDEDYVGAVTLDVENMSIDTYNDILGKLVNEGILIEDAIPDYEFSENEYLIIPPPNNDASLGDYSVYRYNKCRFHYVRGKEIKNNWTGSIYPRNPEQVCLVDALVSNIPIIYAGGKYGTGKTFLTHNYAIRELEADRIKKIVYIPNNSYTQNTMDLGALPGDLMEKIMPSIGPLIDLVGIDQVQRWISEEKLEIVPVAYIRGRSFDDCILLVSEAENLTEEHAKLLLGRCGDNTKIYFDGDIHQADSAIFKDRNGLKLLLNLHESAIHAPLFATIQLNIIERSVVASAADYLDNI